MILIDALDDIDSSVTSSLCVVNLVMNFRPPFDINHQKLQVYGLRFVSLRHSILTPEHNIGITNIWLYLISLRLMTLTFTFT